MIHHETDVRPAAELAYRFGRAQQAYRGARPDLTKPYFACVGGAETAARFVERSYPDLLSDELPLPCVNWGVPGAGPWFVLKDPILLEAASRARACVISVSDAYLVSNRLYTVHVARNDRLSGVSESMEALFPGVDFSRFGHVRRMLDHLHDENPSNFRVVELEIRDAWVSRMQELLDAIQAPKILLAMGDHLMEDAPFRPGVMRLGPEMVSRAMLDDLRPSLEALVLVEADEDMQCPGGEDRVYEEGARALALSEPGEEMHIEAAELLFGHLKALMRQPATRNAALVAARRVLGL